MTFLAFKNMNWSFQKFLVIRKKDGILEVKYNNKFAILSGIAIVLISFGFSLFLLTTKLNTILFILFLICSHILIAKLYWIVVKKIFKIRTVALPDITFLDILKNNKQEEIKKDILLEFDDFIIINSNQRTTLDFIFLVVSTFDIKLQEEFINDDKIIPYRDYLPQEMKVIQLLS